MQSINVTCVEGYWAKKPQWQWWRRQDVPDRCRWRSRWDRTDMIWQPGGRCKQPQTRRREWLQHHEPRSPLFPESGKRHFITLFFITWLKCAARGGLRYLEGCDNDHPQTGNQAEYKSSFVHTWPHHIGAPVYLLHKLELGVHRGNTCVCAHACVCACGWRSDQSLNSCSNSQIPREPFCFHLLKRGNVNSHTLFSWDLGEAQNCLTELRNRGNVAGVVIPAHADTKVIRPNMQLSGGVALVSLEAQGRRHFYVGISSEYLEIPFHLIKHFLQSFVLICRRWNLLFKLCMCGKSTVSYFAAF